MGGIGKREANPVLWRLLPLLLLLRTPAVRGSEKDLQGGEVGVEKRVIFGVSFRVGRNELFRSIWTPSATPLPSRVEIVSVRVWCTAKDTFGVRGERGEGSGAGGRSLRSHSSNPPPPLGTSSPARRQEKKGGTLWLLPRMALLLRTGLGKACGAGAERGGRKDGGSKKEDAEDEVEREGREAVWDSGVDRHGNGDGTGDEPTKGDVVDDGEGAEGGQKAAGTDRNTTTTHPRGGGVSVGRLVLHRHGGAPPPPPPPWGRIPSPLG